jgi:hydrogenase assembly chaperone HypC/HupF
MTSQPTPERADQLDACELTDGCITCGDVAVPLTVVEAAGSDARCRDRHGRVETVATELVGPVRPGDWLLVHAGIAIQRLDREPEVRA